MPIVRPFRLTARGIVSTLLPSHFMKSKHPMQLAPEDTRRVRVPWDVEEDIHRTKTKIKGLRKALMTQYEAGKQEPAGTGRRERHHTWCVTTGNWKHHTLLAPTRIFPPTLGTSMAKRIMGGYSTIWTPDAALMLPKGPMTDALQEFALVIVPHSDEPLPHGGLGPNAHYKFRVVDDKHPAMSKPIYRDCHPKDCPTVAGLNQKHLQFRGTSRPVYEAPYVHTCCAVWKKTFQENPTCEDEEEFGERFLQHMEEIWGSRRTNLITEVFLMKHRESEKEKVFTYKGPRIFRKVPTEVDPWLLPPTVEESIAEQPQLEWRALDDTSAQPTDTAEGDNAPIPAWDTDFSSIIFDEPATSPSTSDSDLVTAVDDFSSIIFDEPATSPSTSDSDLATAVGEEQSTEEQPTEEQPTEEQAKEEQPTEEQPREESPREESPREGQPTEEIVPKDFKSWKARQGLSLPRR